ncbi:MAG: DUF92 domain-containing protein [Planctomycetota bacterium]|jgi:uncharacterized protein (TIGR00297 family)
MTPDGWLPVLFVPLVAVTARFTRAVGSGGAVAGLVVGGALTVGLGWAGFFMLMALVLLGTLLSQRGKRQRDAWQVLCNGAVASVFALSGWTAGAAGALAAALSDTASSEIGGRLGARTKRLLFGAPVEPGTDGGMSWMGTLAGLVFAWPVPLLGWAFGVLPSFAVTSAVAAAGMTGNLIDSILGTSIQQRLGRRGNDLVNLLATAAAALLAQGA